MASGDAEVKLYLDHIKVVVEHATDEALTAIAHQIEAQTKANIVANNQVDTGFLLNSVYVVSRWYDGRVRNGYDDARSKAESQSLKKSAGTRLSRRLHQRVTVTDRMAPKEELPAEIEFGGKSGALIVVGANYAIYQEVKRSFLFWAASIVATRAGGIAEEVYRERIHD